MAYLLPRIITALGMKELNTLNLGLIERYATASYIPELVI